MSANPFDNISHSNIQAISFRKYTWIIHQFCLETSTSVAYIYSFFWQRVFLRAPWFKLLLTYCVFSEKEFPKLPVYSGIDR